MGGGAGYGNAELVSCVRMTDEDRPRLLENRRLTAGLHPIKAMEPTRLESRT